MIADRINRCTIIRM